MSFKHGDLVVGRWYRVRGDAFRDGRPGVSHLVEIKNVGQKGWLYKCIREDGAYSYPEPHQVIAVAYPKKQDK